MNPIMSVSAVSALEKKNLELKKKLAIILVAPQMGENIGAAARAMKNFGFSDLRIVSPRDGWPNEKAEIVSAGGHDIIKQAQVFSSVEEAVADLSYIYATTGNKRDINKNYVLSRNLAKDIPQGVNIGILFGRENWGLNNQEIAFANKILVIDTSKDYASLNIAQAVSIICYELFGAQEVNRDDLNNTQVLASANDLNYFYKHLFTRLEQKGFFRIPEKKKRMTLKIRHLFGRLEELSVQEVQILHGIVTALADD